MKRLLILTFLLTAISFGDGLPLDEDGNYGAPHTLIDPTPSQVEEIEALNTLTLTKEQWARLRKVSPDTPKRLNGIIPFITNDCTCGLFWSAIRRADGRIIIPHEAQTVDSIGRLLKTDLLGIQVDRRGQFHIDGTLVRFPLLLKAIEASEPRLPRSQPESRFTLGIPPHLDRDDPVFEDRLDLITEALTSKGWTPHWR